MSRVDCTSTLAIAFAPFWARTFPHSFAPLSNSECGISPRCATSVLRLSRTSFLQRQYTPKFPLSISRAYSRSSNNGIRCDNSENVLTAASSTISATNWKTELQRGRVIEVWTQGELRFALVNSLYPKGVIANFVQIASDETTLSSDRKVSFGEIVSVWPESITPTGPRAASSLAKIADMGLTFLKNSLPRSLDLADLYANLRRVPKSDPAAMQTSYQLSRTLFPMCSTAKSDRLAAITVAAAILLAADALRFKRAGPGFGWRALPPSVGVSRGRCSFVDTCKAILESGSAGVLRPPPPVWSRRHLEILRDIEIIAASGTAATGTAASILSAMGYEPTDDGAARLLLDIQYWATGSVAKHGGGRTARDEMRKSMKTLDDTEQNRTGASMQQNAVQNGRNGNVVDGSPITSRPQGVRDWTFPPELLDEARELRASTRERRSLLLKSDGEDTENPRRNLMRFDGHPLRVYCIDDKTTKFLDDAMSVQVFGGGSMIRICLHVTDVDEVVKSGSPMDDLAKERGQSLYLPLKPLHMLPAAAMDAASFSSSVPTEAISVMIDFDVENDLIQNWEVFASVVPPVRRLTYDQFDIALQKGADHAQISEEECEDLRQFAVIAPRLAEKLDRRTTRRRQRSATSGPEGVPITDGGSETKGVISVRIVKRADRASSRSVKVAQVVDFQSTGAHGSVDDLLTSAGALIRQFARENRASLPENKGAFAYAARCGTAPLRRYTDLAIQRQIKCVLFGKQPAGRRRMEELRAWLAKRQVAGERTVAERRRGALFDALSTHCAQQCAATGITHAVVQGQVRNITVTKRGHLRVDVSLDGTGLSAIANISEKTMDNICGRVTPERAGETGTKSTSETKDNSAILAMAKTVLPLSSKVRVQILNIDTVMHKIVATVTQILA